MIQEERPQVTITTNDLILMRLNDLGNRMDRLEKRMDKVEEKIEKLDDKIDANHKELNSKIDRLADKIDSSSKIRQLIYIWIITLGVLYAIFFK